MVFGRGRATLALTGVLAGAVLQNLLAGRDPQLAVLYILAALTLGVGGAGRYSLDARRARPDRKKEPT